MVAIELEFNPEEQARSQNMSLRCDRTILKRNGRTFRCSGLAHFKAVHHTDVIPVQAIGVFAEKASLSAVANLEGNFEEPELWIASVKNPLCGQC